MSSTIDNIFAKATSATSLRQFATSVFDCLGFGNLEEHYSANYWGEQYFIAFKGDVSLTVAATDDTGFEDYPFWISIKAPESDDDNEIEARKTMGDELARRLTLADFDVTRPYTMADWLFRKPIVRRVVYRRESADENRHSEHVETSVEEIRVQL